MDIVVCLFGGSNIWQNLRGYLGAPAHRAIALILQVGKPVRMIADTGGRIDIRDREALRWVQWAAEIDSSRLVG